MLEEKTLVTCILAAMPDVALGKVTAVKNDSGVMVKYEIKFPKEIKQKVQGFIKNFDNESLKIDARLLANKFIYVDNIARTKISQIERKS